MNKDLLPAEGECRCGKIAMRIDAPPILTMACHCSGCQKMSASAYSLTAAIPRDAFSVTRGEPVIGGLHGEDARHFFCPYCMTWLFTRLNDSLPFVNVRPTLFANLAWSTPFIETWTRENSPGRRPRRYTASRSFHHQPHLKACYRPTRNMFRRRHKQCESAWLPQVSAAVCCLLFSLLCWSL